MVSKGFCCGRTELLVVDMRRGGYEGVFDEGKTICL
jgi:hypothetical protein